MGLDCHHKAEGSFDYIGDGHPLNVLKETIGLWSIQSFENSFII